ncbi:presenilin-associated rhomboid-like protein, mitochondrial [Neocloeon triangulifer]|uniref:presenilin-associated rhomboid-like protein, mitochondrial n=1 Tax=Neocloeon triangulifer TaxID=2078957 RepID=UPI00286F46EA|nr:presenilin-associated rhomboid-like protein, mitochondrial [Neocloeon triangulifer]XP_059472816.1 presenilin-associated rhomboid-like protein, mitochondrial [Neocloeon triangulifer]
MLSLAQRRLFRPPCGGHLRFFRMGKVAPSSENPSRNILKPVLFTGVVGSTCFVGASLWQYEGLRSKVIQRQDFSTLLQPRVRKTGTFRQHVNGWWNNLTEGQRIFVPILACNVAIFCAWQLPRLQPFMYRFFSADPAQRAVCWPMLLSTFSHQSAFHLATNMFVLHSFCSGAVASLGKEQFLGLYLTSGVVSSLVSHLYKVSTKFPGRSLGASGAIMAILGYVCTAHPDIRLSIIFLPQFNFTGEMAIKCLLLMDSVGMVLRWRFFDHAAHLGGALFGIFWAMYGQGLWMKREVLVTWWHNQRGVPSK